MSALGTAPVAGDSRTASEDEEEGKEWIGDPQGRAAARIAERRDKEGGAGFVPSGGAGGAAYGAGQGKRRGWKRWWVLALGVLAIVALAVGLGVGLTAGRKNGGSGNLAAQKEGTTTTNGTTTDASGNSTSFTKDPRLHNSFHAFAYTPQNVLLPA
jgi:hypothetical protein